MLENSEKGYHMVKKACTMMHSLIDKWKPPPGTFRPGKQSEQGGVQQISSLPPALSALENRGVLLFRCTYPHGDMNVGLESRL